VSPPATGNGSTSQDTAESAAARPEPLPGLSGLSSGDQEADGGESRFGFSRGRVAIIVGGAIASVAVAGVLMLVLTGDDTTPPPNDFGNTPSIDRPASGPGGSSSSGGSSASSSLTSADRRATKVAVLNGTTQPGLARSVGDKIEKDSFTIGSVTNNADQSVPTTIVSFTAGHEQAALEVARVIGIDRGSVQAADANTAAAADADVVVTVGSDQIG
jgi:hypothetical protein